jgi:acyl-coenzyme A thioesterase PaaI-like protein
MPVMMTAQELNDFMGQVFQQVADDFNVDHVGEGEVTMRLLVSDKHLRPGGTVSGPSMFGLADVAAYIVTLSQISCASLPPMYR